MIAQMKEGCDKARAETLTSHQKKIDPHKKKLRDRNTGLMKDLLSCNGGLKYQPHIQKDPDPLANIEEFPNDNFDNDLSEVPGNDENQDGFVVSGPTTIPSDNIPPLPPSRSSKPTNLNLKKNL